MTEPIARPRMQALDVFRGLTVGAMILVNNPGSWTSIWPPLRHAAWHGCTPTDLIFPFFLFIVGASLFLAQRGEASKHGGAGVSSGWLVAARRAGVLIALGLLLNWFGHWDFASLRVPGVLQRIGLCYFIAWIIIKGSPTVVQVTIGLLLVLHTTLLFVGADSAPDALAESGNLQAKVDDAILGRGHLYSRSPTDPEGLLSTLSATATVLMGYLSMRYLSQSATSSPANADSGEPVGLAAPHARLLSAGIIVSAVGWLSAGAPAPWDWFATPSGILRFDLPLNKPLWTASYAILTGGLAMISLAVLIAIEQSRLRDWLAPLWSAGRAMGRNAIVVFVGSGLFARLLTMIPAPVSGGATGTLKTRAHELILATGLSPVAASLAFALLTVTVWTLVALIMQNRRFFVRV